MRTHIEWKVDTHIALARRPTSASTRSFISAAALLVKVIDMISPGCTPRSASSQPMRWVSTLVLPEPAPATMSSGEPACVTASRCRGLSPSSSAAPRAVAGWTGVVWGSSNSALIVSNTVPARPDRFAPRRAPEFPGAGRCCRGTTAVAHCPRAIDQSAIFLRVPDTGARGLLTSPHDAPRSPLDPGRFCVPTGGSGHRRRT